MNNKRLIYAFYEAVAEKYRPRERDLKQFKVSVDGKTLYWVVGDIEINLMAKTGGVSFRSLASLATEYTKKYGQKRGDFERRHHRD